MKLNTKVDPIYTHEGAKACHINPLAQLKRSVCSCLLWEDSFYEDGIGIAQRIIELIPKVNAEEVANLAIHARTKGKLRHVPLLLARYLAKQKYKNIANLLEQIIQRPDELTEFIAIYHKDKREPLSAQVKKGLAKAFAKFNEYQFAKHDRNGKIKLRDVMCLCHPKPKDEEQSALYKRILERKLATPDTWEVALTTTTDKKATWERLLTENKLGALALLRNLRNMREANVDIELIKAALEKIKTERVLPYRFIAAAQTNPQLEEYLEPVMLRCINNKDKLSGKTILLIDVSGSMQDKLSSKSDLKRIDAACGLAILLREMCEDIAIYTFSAECVCVPSRHGFALRDTIITSQPHRATYLGGAINKINNIEGGKKHHNRYHIINRVIVITDEQSHDAVLAPSDYIFKQNYMINVASCKNGVGYGAWNHIDGFSESVVGWIYEYEQLQYQLYYPDDETLKCKSYDFGGYKQ